jgi:hypothetical protein
MPLFIRSIDMKPRHDVWLFEWFDAFDVSSEWSDIKDLDVLGTTVQSVGFLIDPSPIAGYVTLVTSDDGDGNVSNGINIPLVNVVNRIRLS